MLNLKRSFIIASTAIALSSPVFAAPETYVFEDNHTSVMWTAGHFGFSNPSGKFMDVTGSVTLDQEKPENSKVSATIKPASVVTGIEKFDNHLKSADFFNVEKFSTAKFESNKVTLTGENTAKVHGTLTLLDVSKPVTLDVVLNKIGENPMNKIATAGFTATANIKRSEWGINYAIGGVTDEVKLLIEVEAQKQ